jgi:hypothetical protein
MQYVIFFCNHLNLTQSLTPPFPPYTACIILWPRSIILQPDIQHKFCTGALYQDIHHFVNLCQTLPKKSLLYNQGIFFLTGIPIRVLVCVHDQSTRRHFVPITYQALTWAV